MLLKLPKSLGRGCITSQDDQGASLGEEILDSLMGEAPDYVKGAGTIGGACVVSEVDIVVLWESLSDLREYCQASIA